MHKPSANAVDGRVLAARPSLLLLLPVAFVAVALFAAATARAAVQPPLLEGTNPHSPGLDPEPSVIGDGGMTFAIDPISGGAGPVTRDVNPDSVVTLYKDSECKGAVIGVGTTAELHGSGIEATVDLETTTHIYGTRTEGSETSACSSPALDYEHVKELPPDEETPGGGTPGGGQPGGQPGGQGTSGGSAAPPAPRLRTLPGARANDNTPLVTGTALGAGSVRVFANPNCSGTPVTKGTASELSAGLEVQVADNTVTSFSGVSIAGGNQSPCSSPVTYVEDSTAPRTRITMGPGVKTRRRKAVFRFTDTSGDPPGTSFLCKVDRQKWKQCRSPFKLRHLGLRGHVLRVRGIDLAGNAEAKGAKRSFKVVRSS